MRASSALRTWLERPDCRSASHRLRSPRAVTRASRARDAGAITMTLTAVGTIRSPKAYESFLDWQHRIGNKAEGS